MKQKIENLSALLSDKNNNKNQLSEDITMKRLQNFILVPMFLIIMNMALLPYLLITQKQINLSGAITERRIASLL